MAAFLPPSRRRRSALTTVGPGQPDPTIIELEMEALRSGGGGAQRARLTAFFTGALRAGVARVVGTLRVAVVVRVAVAFLAAVLRTGAAAVVPTPLASLGARLGVITASLNAFSGVMRAFFDALMRMASPVAGLRPMRAGRSILANLAN